MAKHLLSRLFNFVVILVILILINIQAVLTLPPKLNGRINPRPTSSTHEVDAPELPHLGDETGGCGSVGDQAEGGEALDALVPVQLLSDDQQCEQQRRLRRQEWFERNLQGLDEHETVTLAASVEPPPLPLLSPADPDTQDFEADPDADTHDFEAENPLVPQNIQQISLPDSAELGNDLDSVDLGPHVSLRGQFELVNNRASDYAQESEDQEEITIDLKQEKRRQESVLDPHDFGPQNSYHAQESGEQEDIDLEQRRRQRQASDLDSHDRGPQNSDHEVDDYHYMPLTGYHAQESGEQEFIDLALARRQRQARLFHMALIDLLLQIRVNNRRSSEMNFNICCWLAILSLLLLLNFLTNWRS